MTSGGPAERQEDDPTSPWWGEHASRYQWAASEARGKVVLDAACGTGFGVGILSRCGATLAVGLDLDSEAVTRAAGEVQGRLTAFLLGDVTQLPFHANTFDLVTTFETIEHVPDFVTCLQEFSRVLKEGGVLFCSTPNRAISSPDGIVRNPYHVREFTVAEFRQTLADVFGDVRVFGQRCRRDSAGRSFSRAIWRLLTSRGIRKLPFDFRETLSQTFTHAPLFPAPDEFVVRLDPEGAPTLLGVCRKTGALAGRVRSHGSIEVGGIRDIGCL